MALKAVNENKGNLVREWKQGNVTIKVYDGAYAGKTPAELQKVRDEIDRACWDCIESARRAGKAV
jgi:hypothetical protein